MLLRLRDVSLSIEAAPILRRITLVATLGETIAIVGLNGAGKSTLLEVMANLRHADSGDCIFDGRPLNEWQPKQLARRICFVPQSVRADIPYLAREVVLMGRGPHAAGWYESPRDHAVAEEAMNEAACWHLRDRDFRTLSGGERQRVILAAALAQEADLLLLDEPATFLDVPHQLQLCRMLQRLAARGKTCIAVTHDLNLAATFFKRTIVLRCGEVYRDGPTAEVLDQDLCTTIFGPGLHVELDRKWIRYEA